MRLVTRCVLVATLPTKQRIDVNICSTVRRTSWHQDRASSSWCTVLRTAARRQRSTCTTSRAPASPSRCTTPTRCVRLTKPSRVDPERFSKSITGFAHACFKMALAKKMPLVCVHFFSQLRYRSRCFLVVPLDQEHYHEEVRWPIQGHLPGPLRPVCLNSPLNPHVMS